MWFNEGQDNEQYDRKEGSQKHQSQMQVWTY
jgi:hypothetical protein